MFEDVSPMLCRSDHYIRECKYIYNVVVEMVIYRPVRLQCTSDFHWLFTPLFSTYSGCQWNLVEKSWTRCWRHKGIVNTPCPPPELLMLLISATPSISARCISCSVAFVFSLDCVWSVLRWFGDQYLFIKHLSRIHFRSTSFLPRPHIPTFRHNTNGVQLSPNPISCY